MAGIERRSLVTGDEVYDFPDGSRTEVLVLGNDAFVMRSVMQPGWNWTDAFGEGNPDASCPMHHREVIVSGRMRFRMDDGAELLAEPGDYLEIQPGHLAWVEGNEPCVAIDW